MHLTCLNVVPAIVAQVLDKAKDMIPQALSNSLLALVLFARFSARC